MPVTVKVVEPMKVRGVLDSMGTPSEVVVFGTSAVVKKSRCGGGSVTPVKSPGFPPGPAGSLAVDAHAVAGHTERGLRMGSAKRGKINR